MIKTIPIPAFHDNYIWAIHNAHDTSLVVVDPGDAKPVVKYLKDNQLSLAGILITHHHHDHTGGVQALCQQFQNVNVYGPLQACQQINQSVAQDDQFNIDSHQLSFKVIAIPGHTLDHIAYYNKQHQLLFCGDTLFSAGCGRVFEGTMAQMLQSLETLAALPGDTKIYCGHEYTLNNLQFAQTLEPDNTAISQHIATVSVLRQQGQCSLPSTIQAEKSFNPFLRCALPDFQSAVKMTHHAPLKQTIDFFTLARQLKDRF